MEGNVSVEEEILKADDLMYAEKQQYYHAILQGDRRARTGIATELLEDIADHRFEVYYQPQISLKSGRIIGAEALVRKRNKRGSLILPDRFIPHYERERVICHWIYSYSRQSAPIGRNGKGRGWKPISLPIFPVLR